ncbi:MAG: hypothetical protein Q7V57_04360 [Actinomycetota bacterium]|nr:hypothetical protein [Actinomycetota bacterium]
MLTALASILVGAGMSGVLWVFYRHVEDEWPAGYRTVSTRYDLFSRRVVLWHLTSRLLVVFSASALTAHLATAVGGSPALAVAALALSHVGLTSIRASWKARSRKHRGSLVAAYNLALTVALLLAAVLGMLAAPHLEWAFPSSAALVDSIWIALAVAVLLTAIERLAHSVDRDEQAELAQAKRDVGDDALAALDVSASEHDADSRLMRCIVFSESLQRPRWVRRAERLVGRVRPAGSYGVAQIRSDRPLTDSESLVGLARSLTGSRSRLRTADDEMRMTYVEAYLERHNRDRVFVDQASRFFEMLAEPSAIAESDGRAADGRAVVEIVGVVRSGFEWKASGSWMPSTSDDDLEFSTDQGSPIARFSVAGNRERTSWTVRIGFEVRSAVATTGSVELVFDPQALRVDW